MKKLRNSSCLVKIKFISMFQASQKADKFRHLQRRSARHTYLRWKRFYEYELMQTSLWTWWSIRSPFSCSIKASWNIFNVQHLIRSICPRNLQELYIDTSMKASLQARSAESIWLLLFAVFLLIKIILLTNSQCLSTVALSTFILETLINSKRRSFC